LKGKNMYGKFKNNKLKSLIDIGNSEVIFYLRDENQKLIGISKMKSSNNIFIILDNNTIKSIDFNTKPEGKTYPPSEFEILPPNAKLFKGFSWREDEQPLTKEAIFIHDKPNTEEKEIPKN